MSINVTMPALSPTMTDGTLARWLKAEGDSVEAGDVIAEIETDKATMEVEAVDEGVLGKIIVPAGTENVPVNDVIAVLLEDGESADDIGDVSSASKPPASLRANEGSDAIQSKGQADEEGGLPCCARAPRNDVKASDGNRVFASPLAKRIAADKGIDLSAIKGSGPRGRIVKTDVENAKLGAAPMVTAVSGAVAQALPEDAKINVYGMAYTEIPNNNIKKVTAKRLTESKQSVPHFYLSVECALDNLLAARKELNEKANGEYKLSVNDFIGCRREDHHVPVFHRSQLATKRLPMLDHTGKTGWFINWGKQINRIPRAVNIFLGIFYNCQVRQRIHPDIHRIVHQATIDTVGR